MNDDKEHSTELVAELGSRTRYFGLLLVNFKWIKQLNVCIAVRNFVTICLSGVNECPQRGKEMMVLSLNVFLFAGCFGVNFVQTCEGCVC